MVILMVMSRIMGAWYWDGFWYCVYMVGIWFYRFDRLIP